MGVTREQKAKAEASRQRARLDREAREAAERKIVRFVATLEHAETGLVAAAFCAIHTHGVRFVHQFEEMERKYEALRRAQAVLERFSIRTRSDYDAYARRTAHLWKEWPSSQGDDGTKV